VTVGEKEVTVAVLTQLHQVLSGRGGAPMGVIEVVLVNSPSVKRFWAFAVLLTKRNPHKKIRILEVFS
jgi:hypothetical protein